MKFGDSSWNMPLRIWIDNPKCNGNVRSDINGAIDLHLRTLTTALQSPAANLRGETAPPDNGDVTLIGHGPFITEQNI